MRKFSKYLLRIFLIVIGVLLLVVALFYTPAIQKVIKNKIERMVEKQGMVLSIERLSVKFPLVVELDNVFLGENHTDTILYASEINIGVGLNGIWRKELGASQVSLKGVAVNYADDSTGMRLRGTLAALLLDVDRIDLNNNQVEAGYLQVDKGDIYFLAVSTDTEDTTVSAPLNWYFDLNRGDLYDVKFRMTSESIPMLYADLTSARIRHTKADLGQQFVDADSVALSQGTAYIFLNSTDSTGITTETEPRPEADTLLWTITANTVELANYNFEMKNETDTAYIFVLSNIAVRLDSVYNRGTVVRAVLRDLQLREEKTGVIVQSMQADLEMTEEVTEAGNVFIRTPYSTVKLNARADGEISEITSEVPVDLRLEASVGMPDIRLFVTDLPANLDREMLNINTEVSYMTDLLAIPRLEMEMPGNFSLSGSGEFRNLTGISDLTGRLNISGTLRNGSLARGYIRNVALPGMVNLTLNASADHGVIQPSLRIFTNREFVNLQGEVNLNTEAYTLNMDVDEFNIGAYLPLDSVGILTAKAEVEGRGFSLEDINADARVRIDSFDFRNHFYRDIDLVAGLHEKNMTAHINSGDPDMLLNLDLAASMSDSNYTATVKGQIEHVDFASLNFTTGRMILAADIDAGASFTMNRSYQIDARVDNVFMDYGRGPGDLGDLTVKLNSVPERTFAEIQSGDFTLQFSSDTIISELASVFGNSISELTNEITLKRIDVQRVKETLPHFTLKAEGHMDNIVGRILREFNIAFNKINLDIESLRNQDFYGKIKIDRPVINSFRADSVYLSFRQDSNILNYDLSLLNPMEIIDSLYKLSVHGMLNENRLEMSLYQENLNRDTVLDIGLRVIATDSSYIVNVFPETPNLRSHRWGVNENNQIIFYHDNRIIADLHMSEGNNFVDLGNVDDPNLGPNSLTVKLGGINIASITSMTSLLPDLSGILNVDLRLNRINNRIAAAGKVNLGDFHYETNRIGDVGVNLGYGHSNSRNVDRVVANIYLDEEKRIELNGTIADSTQNERITFDLNILALPLTLANAFIPDDVMGLQGSLNGAARITGSTSAPELSGSLTFSESYIDFYMVGAHFGIDSSPLVLENGKLNFNDFKITSPNSQALSINGDVRLLPFAEMGADLKIAGRNFQVVDVNSTDNSLLSGRAFADVDVTAAGAFTALNITGNVNLLNNTSVNYLLGGDTPEVRDRSLEMVQFVSFRDTVGIFQPNRRIQSGSTVSVDLFIGLANSVSVNVDLFGDGNVSVQGGGDLNFSMGDETGMVLTGRYILNDGYVTYAIPVMGAQNFAILTGSSVDWTGRAENPELNISASRPMRINVTDDNGASRIVNFEIIIRINNNLQNPEILFDLNTPNDQVIQGQLTAYSAEERSREALNLLINGTYTGLGSAGSGSNQGLNSTALMNNFIEQELNQFSRDLLGQGALTFGLDTYDQGNAGETRTDFSYQFSQQLFNDRVNIRVGGRLYSDAEGQDLEQNLVNDIVLEYYFSNNRNWLAKLFRHANYESVLEGEIISTGVGVVWRKSFRKFRSIFQSEKSGNNR